MQNNYNVKKLTLTDLLSSRLGRLKNPPSSLFYRGIDINKLNSKIHIAIVGTRKMSPYGRAVTETIASKLASAGIVIVSGNALGVDVTAQKAALQARGTVLAVVTSGLDAIYPATNRAVAEKIIEQGGAVLSEYSTDHQPRPEQFLERNRIIAALCDAVIITEAAERSGSLNTAAHAKAMNIPIFAVPGPINNSLNSGTNRLIKEGAQILTSPDDVLEFFGVLDRPTAEKVQTNLTIDESLVLSALDQGQQDTMTLQLATCKTAAEIQTILTMLEINGVIKQDAIGNWQKN